MEIAYENLSDWIKLILSFSDAKNRISQYFYAVSAAANKKKWKSIYPKMARIAHYSKCSTRTVQRFLSDMTLFGVQAIPRFNETGRQTTNILILPKNFLKALNWIDRHHGFNASEDYKKDLIALAKKEDKPVSSQWMSPSPPPSCHPYSSSFSPMQIGVLLRGELKKSFYPCLESIEIPLEAKIGISCYPERSVAMAIEDLQRRKTQTPDLKLFLAWRAGIYSGTRIDKGKPPCENSK